MPIHIDSPRCRILHTLPLKVTSVLLNAINIDRAGTTPRSSVLALMERLIRPVCRRTSFRVPPMKRKSWLFLKFMNQTPSYTVVQHYHRLGECSSTTEESGYCTTLFRKLLFGQPHSWLYDRLLLQTSKFSKNLRNIIYIDILYQNHFFFFISLNFFCRSCIVNLTSISTAATVLLTIESDL